MQRVATECGDIGSFRIGPFRFVLVNSSELIHAALVERDADFVKGWPQTQTLKPIFGNGLSSSEGEFHRRQRKMLQPAFQPRRLASYADTMVAYNQNLAQSIADGVNVDVAQEMGRLTMSIVGKAMFNADVFTETTEIGAAIIIAARDLARRSNQPIPLPADRRTRAALELITHRIQTMVNQRRASGEDAGDFLSMLLLARDEQGCPMSDQQIRDEAMTIFVAGHETTAIALTWAFHLLGKNPDVYARLLTEVDRVLAGRPPTHADLARLPYTLQVLKEALRLYPPAPYILRFAARGTQIGSYRISRWQPLIVSPYVTHRRTDYFPNPQHFDPDRFTVENEKRLPRYAWIPFGAGSRVCIGQHFALMETHLTLAALSQHLTFTPLTNREPVIDATLTLRPKGGLMMVAHRRSEFA